MEIDYDWTKDVSRLNRTFAGDLGGTPPRITISDQQRWDDIVADCRSGEDVFVVRIPDARVILGQQCPRLWPPEQVDIRLPQLSGLFHPEQLPLIKWLAPQIFQILFHHAGKEQSKNFRLRWFRGILTTSGTYQYVVYDCVPFQYTDSRVMYSYIGRITYLKAYNGEPLHVRFHYDGEPNLQDDYKLDVLNGYLAGLLRQIPRKVFQLTKKQIRVLELRASGVTVAATAKKMNIESSTVKHHSREVLDTFRLLLISVDLRNFDDLLRYLRQLKILETS